jgi:hypothetical protein
MTMSPDEFQQRYADALAHEPAPAPLEHDLAVVRGRHQLRRRRFAAATAGGVAVVAIVGGSLTLGKGGDGKGDDSVPAGPPTSSSSPGVPDETQLLYQCRTGELQDPTNARRFFSSGTPLVKSVASASSRTSAALESADGKYWAWCRIDTAAPETNEMDVYLARGDRGATFFSYGGLGCPEHADQGNCSTFVMRWAERLSPRVAQVEFVMGDGESLRIEGNEGYFALEYLADLPRNLRPDRDGVLPDSFNAFDAVTYFDANGDPIAAQGGSEGRLPGVPSLGRYPFLGTQPRVTT